MMFPTPVGKSYACSEETEISLTDGKNQASVLLRYAHPSIVSIESIHRRLTTGSDSWRCPYDKS